MNVCITIMYSIKYVHLNKIVYYKNIYNILHLFIKLFIIKINEGINKFIY